MNRRAQTIIGLTVIALGLGLFGLGFLDQESTVRQVNQVVAAPEAHTDGTYTLVGMPQPAVLEGQPGAPPNPDHDNATKRYHSWTQDGVSFVTVWTQTYRWLDEDTLEWRVENSTRRTDATAPPVVSNHTWTQDWTGVVLQVDDFESGDTVWALFDGNLREPMRPTPSQLTGRTLPTPDGFLVYQIEPDGYTMGCSSKFVPEDRRDEFDKDGDGYTD